MFSSSISKCSIDYARQCWEIHLIFNVIYYHDFVGFRVSTREKSVIPQFDFFEVDLSLYILLRSVMSKSFKWYSQTSVNYNMFTLQINGGVSNRPALMFIIQPNAVDLSTRLRE